MLVLCGKAGTGKTTIAKLLEEKHNMHRIVGYTTRPMREGEINGVDYIFVTHLDDTKEYFVRTSFPSPDGGEPWEYGILMDDIKNATEDTLFVANPAEVKQLIKDNIDCYIIQLAVSPAERKRRMIQRGDKNWEERYERDDRDFDEEILEHSLPFANVNTSPLLAAFYIKNIYKGEI